MATWRFKTKREFLGQLWKVGETIELPEDYFEALEQEVPKEMGLDKGPDPAENPKDVRAWRGSRDHSGETAEQQAQRKRDEAVAASVPDTGPSEEGDGLGDL